MTYAQFSTRVRAAVWPEGEAENLVDTHKNWVLDALIDLQQKVPCLQHYHKDQHANDWLFNCGASFFTAPRGFIFGLYTVLDDDWCPKVRYDPVSEDQMRCLLADNQECGKLYDPYPFYYEYSVYYPYGVMPYGTYYPIETDKACRSTAGVFSLIRGDIYTYPHLQNNEIAVLEWDGIKRSWGDSETMPDAYDREVEEAVEFSLEAKTARKDDRNPDGFALARSEYNSKVAQLIWQCQKERRLPPRQHCFSNCGECG